MCEEDSNGDNPHASLDEDAWHLGLTHSNYNLIFLLDSDNDNDDFSDSSDVIICDS